MDKEEGHLRYQREKQSRQRVLDVEAVNILKLGLESKRLQIERKDDRMTKHMDALAVEETTLCKRREILEKDKKVRAVLYFVASFFKFFIRLLSLCLRYLTVCYVPS